ncbi:MAG: translation initiation factor IF-2 [Acetatifactor sp.]|nr:translation initiation factor IF-2 [Acetatifactor sp.]
MAKIKVHELAKELDKQSKDILSFLQEKGIEAKVAQSSIDEEAAQLVRKAFGKSAPKAEASGKKEASEAKEAAKKETAEKQKPAKEDAAKEKSTKNAPEKEKPVKKSSEKAESGQESAARKEAPKKEPQTQETQAQASARENGQPKGQGAPREDAPKKKKSNIIFVSNPQNSKMSGQRPGGNGRPQGGQGRGGNGGYNDRDHRSQVPVRPIKPLTPPSPTPSVQMVSSKPQPKAHPEQQASHQENRAQQPEKTPAQSQRPQSAGMTQERPPRDGRSQETRGRDGRDARGSGGYQGTRPERGQFQGRGGNGNGRPQGDRPGSGFQRGARQGAEGASGDRRGPGSGMGSGRSFGGSQRDGRGNGGQGAGFRDNRPGKGFASEAPAKDVEKRREDEKRRASNQERDKRSRKDHIYEEDEAAKNRPGRFIKPEKKKEEAVEEVIKVITLPETITIKDLADKMKLQPSAIVKKLFLEGKIVTVNQEISYEDAENIAMEYEILCEKEVKVDVIEELLKEDEEDVSTMVERPPVICVMGHVDHGKTSLLDAIRNTNVIDKEAGGITQHIGAYTVNVGERTITFLDTPGHEAFTAMRMRGANSTDIAILVVAADDGVMPQTIEAINHAKAAGIEIVVAVNKIDKPSANIDRVKQELTEYELIATDWGGSTEFVPVSAKTGEGIDTLLETILLTADILELKANPKRQARGLVIEAELDKGRGPVATVLVQKGTLHVGDFISAGACHGKVRAMIDDKGRRVKEAGPSMPVEILGLNDVPSAGEVFLAHENDKTAKSYADTYLAQNKERKLEETRSRMSLDDLFSQIKEGNLKELNLIVKADVQGSVEAVKQSLLKLSNEEIVVKCIHGGVGAINESDVTLASASNAIIIGFNVRPDATAKATAEREGVDVRLYKVIYQAIEDIEAAMKGMLDPVFEEKVIGHAEVRQIFKASQIGNIAGSYVTDGVFQRGCKIRISREGEQIYEGALASLKRFKDDVKEVKEGFECGLVFEGFDQIQELDVVEAYIMVEVPR